MDFTFTDDQEQLRRAVRQLGREAGGDGSSEEALWRTLTEQLGLTGIGIDPERGGAGGDFVDAAVVIEEAGRTLLPAPVTTVLVAAAVLGRRELGRRELGRRELGRASKAAAELASQVATGERIAVVAVGPRAGTIDNVLDGDRADAFLIADDDGLWLVDGGSDGVGVRRQTTLDLSRGQAQLVLDDVPAVQIGGAEAARVAVDLLRVALSVEAVGAARHCLDATVAYLKTREQFGRPIGSFQALQHRAADLVVELEAATSTAYYAAWAAAQSNEAESPDELAVVAPLALALCAESAWHVAAETIQMHGGIGFTWEHEAHRYFKRLTTTRAMLGGAHGQRRLVAERAAIAPGSSVR